LQDLGIFVVGPSALADRLSLWSCFHLFEQPSALSGQLCYTTITNFEPLWSNLNLEDWDSKQESYYACRIRCSLNHDILSELLFDFL
jgi:hypothetical protein